ncbi:hypothetical protein BJ508DRAFT_143896 [Ascobolus immersus RN42]|uniref:Defect at low temperature protein 1 n=1 Tax=Ascobolus immersus RN42 TaxID=1160509 RepID=A0A3N4I026_ASCIM|nr:hypothetical protein BJ508DRAFT_240778 [Ascobolus immersus RN42]RPA79299.1 hypothetical protein BJ508DRAFT_143896 [Ascobolus immersus RN42]
MPPFHIPLPRLYQTGFSLLLIATLVLLLVPFLTLIPQFPRPTSSRRFTVPLILFSATYFLILCVSVTIYTHRLWSTRKKLDSLPNARVDFTEIGGRSGDKVRERVKRNIARSAVVGYVGRPKDEDGGAEGKAGRDGAIREVWGLIGTGGGRWEDGGEEEMAELKIGYELIRWAGKEYEKDDALWEAVMRGV